jgi:serine/threonine protein kinase
MLPILAEDRLIGTRIEKCVVERLIGRGGYGLTFLAFDEELQEHRVVKVSNAWAEDETGRKRQEKSFIEEGLILSRLKHPQIVTLRAQGERHGHRYMVLDYIQGFSLKAALDIVGARCAEIGCRWEDLLDPVTATALVLSSLQPLEYAHKANVHLPDREIFGVAHRDISPGNLILGVKGNEKAKVILIDFGTAKTDLSDTTTVNHHLVGTVPYMSKARLQKAATADQAAQHQAFWRSYRETQNDIHALGALFCQLLTGKLPFAGDTTPQIIVRVLDPESYSRIHREMGSAFPALAGVLRKCLVYFDFSLTVDEQPYQYPDASAMRQDLEQAFSALSPGRSLREVLLEFSGKLEEPARFSPPAARTGRIPPHAESAEFVFTDFPAPYQPTLATGRPRSRKPIALLVALIAALSVAAVLVWNRIFDVRSPASLPAAGLENLGPGADDGGPAPAVADKSRGGKKTQGRRKDRGSSPAPIRTSPANPQAAVQGEADTALAGAPEADGNPVGMPPANASQAASQAYQAALEAGNQATDWGQEDFIQVQTLVREENPAAYEKLMAWLAKVPDSPDLLLLKCQLILKRNPTSLEARQILAELQTAQPAFHHPRVFHENAIYMLWQVDAAQYEAQKTPANRVRVLKSANAYLSEFASNAGYAAKVQEIRSRLPGFQEGARSGP